MPDQRSPTYEAVIIEALGQTWHFTPDIVRTLTITGLNPHDTMKMIIMFHGSKKGIDAGEYEIDSAGIPIKLTAKEDLIVVDDPYAW